MNEEAVSMQAPCTKSLPLLMLVMGYVMSVGTAILAGRLTWEMTALTWRRGPQMIGFSLAHGSGVALLFFPQALLLWLLIALVIVLYWKAKRQRVNVHTRIALVSAALVLGLVSLPQAFWNMIFIDKLASSSHASEFLVDACGSGQKSVARGLLQRGVPIGAKNSEGDTSLHLAAATGETNVVKYLIARGADVNALNLYGDSPLHRARENGKTDVVQLLLLHQGRDLKGDEEQRSRATDEIVRRNTEEMYPHAK